MPIDKLVSNVNGSHLEALKYLFSENSERVVIASPFLPSDVEPFLEQFEFSNISSVDLITTFKNCDPEQVTKPKQLMGFFQHFTRKYPALKFKLHVNNSLHGKIYIAQKAKLSNAIISSANFTKNGVLENHEWGISTQDSEIIFSLIEELFESVDYPEITYSQIEKACMFADQYKENHPDWLKTPTVHSDILDQVYSVEDELNLEPQYFLKPIGHSDSPIRLEDKRDFSDLHQNLHFSKKKPKGVRKGDIVITTGVGCGSLLSYFKVTGGLQYISEHEIKSEPWKERWPWYMEGRNQSQSFSSKWWAHNIQRSSALSEYLDKHPSIPVTQAGGFSLGTLNMGNDKVKITKEFGEFLIAKIIAAEKNA